MIFLKVARIQNKENTRDVRRSHVAESVDRHVRNSYPETVNSYMKYPAFITNHLNTVTWFILQCSAPGSQDRNLPDSWCVYREKN